MASITNPDRFPVVLSTGHVIAGYETYALDNDTLRIIWPNIQGRVLAGLMSAEFDPEVVDNEVVDEGPHPATREEALAEETPDLPPPAQPDEGV